MNSNKAFQRGFPNDGNEVDDRPSMADVLIVSDDDAWAVSTEKILNDNLYGVSVASNGDQIIDRLIKHPWYHLVLIDLDSIDVSEDYLVRNIRKIEPDIPIIGLGIQSGGPCSDITYLKKPLTLELIRKIFPQAVSVKETKVGRRTLKGLLLAVCTGLFLWILLIWI